MKQTSDDVANADFAAIRLGVLMSQEPGEPHEAWGVLNPGGVRAPDGSMHLFPRLIAEGNFSRIGHVRIRYDEDTPVAVERLGIALEPHESYEVSAGGGGVEDARVVHVPSLKLYVMTYTAYVPFEPRVAVALSNDLFTWRRLGLLRFQTEVGDPDHNLCGNKDAALFPDVVLDPEGVPSLGILHRPTTRIHVHFGGTDVTKPPCGEETREHIWISYAPIAAVLADVSTLTSVRRHERIMAPAQAWESDKVGTGAPPVRLSYGWMLPYHAVARFEGHPRYCMGAAILDLERPSRVLYRTPLPILVPEMPYERNGLVSDVVFPTATDLRPDGRLDVFYGAADHVVAAARFNLPVELPVAGETALNMAHTTQPKSENHS
ncbi:MAG: glycoside hydrolase family 130 protein [Candidatus Tyrphobacter sp.]